MALYPEILFHFTKKSHLHSILKDGCFKTSYSEEDINGCTKSRKFLVPMVSFGDLRISELREHVGSYGDFGIGLKKKWAIDKKLNPVMYVSQNSNVIDGVINGQELLFDLFTKRRDPSNIEFDSKTYNEALNVLRYVKNYYIRELERRCGKTTKDYVFANEREWRYVPPMNSCLPPIIRIKEDFTCEKERRNYREKLRNDVEKFPRIELLFKPEDIKYLIVKEDLDIDELIAIIKEAKGYSSDETNRLSRLILTIEQIENDF